MAQGLFIIDFDLTITQEHVHNLLFQAIYRGFIGEDDLEAQWEHVKNVPATGSEKQWKALFEKLIHDGHFVAIASFSAHKPIIERYLREKIGLDKDVYQKIFVESWLPENPYKADKSEHILNVIKHFNFQGKPANIVLIDDSGVNLAAARKQAMQVVEVRPGDSLGKHLVSISTLSDEIAKL